MLGAYGVRVYVGNELEREYYNKGSYVNGSIVAQLGGETENVGNASIGNSPLPCV